MLRQVIEKDRKTNNSKKKHNKEKNSQSKYNMKIIYHSLLKMVRLEFTIGHSAGFKQEKEGVFNRYFTMDKCFKGFL